MNFRYFDSAGKQLTVEQLKSMCIVTPVMEHILATVTERMERSLEHSGKLDVSPPEQYN